MRAGPSTGRPSSTPPRRGWERRAKDALLPLACRVFLPPDLREQPTPARPLLRARRILVVRQDHRLGNLILITPFLQALRQVAPEARITLFFGERFEGVLRGAPWFDDTIVMHKRRLIRQPWTYPAHVSEIRNGRFDVAIELSNPDTHSFYNTLVPVISRAPVRVGFDHPRSRAALNAPVAPPRVECHYSRTPLLLLSALGESPPILPMRLPWTPEPVVRGRPLLFHPGGRGEKRWPVEKSCALIRALRDRRVPLLVAGGPGERALLEEITRRLPGIPTRLLGSVRELAAVAAGCRLYVGCDAGPLHVVSAVGVPTIALFFTSHPLRYGPLGADSETLLLGPRSRRRAREDRFPGTNGAGRLAWDERFAQELTRARPRCVSPPSGLDDQAEVAFVRDRILEALR